jgi:mono/diheme cytochrome c family protein
MLLISFVAVDAFAQDQAASQESSPTANASPHVSPFERFGRGASDPPAPNEISETSAGRLLLTELSCTACHASDDAALAPKRGPSLESAGLRIDRDWLVRFLTNPSEAHPGTTMPDVMAGVEPQQRQQVATLIADWLMTRREALPEVQGSGLKPVPHLFWERGDADRGNELFHRVGCVACHAPDPDHPASKSAPKLDPQLALLDPEELAELGLAGATRLTPAQPLPRLSEKTSLRALTLFLLEPERTRPALRMPNLKLSAVEAADIATYLMARESGDGDGPVSDFTTTATKPETAAANAKLPDAKLPDTNRHDTKLDEAKAWFDRLRCAACHDIPGVKSDLAAIPKLSQLDPDATDGCGGDDASSAARSMAPRYRLDADQSAAIETAIETAIEATQADAGSPAKSSGVAADNPMRETMLRSNCYACHQAEALGGVAADRAPFFETVGSVDLGDEGRLPPPLSGFTRKLKPTWLNRVLEGTGMIRPHLHGRMPKYSSDFAKGFVKSFQQAQASIDSSPLAAVASSSANDGSAANDGSTAKLLAPRGWPAAGDVAQVAAGRQLMDAGCVQCHLFRGEGLPGVVGVDLSGVQDRVRPDWFHDFVIHPAGLKPRTRMPTFFPDGVSQNGELLEGDAHRQIASIWGYLGKLREQPLPAKIEELRGQDFELKPTDRPILLRTFMRQAGPQAIAVGFPQSTHFAFDAENFRLATAWTGRFLDAQGTWFIRAAPPADPLGEAIVSIDRGLPLETEGRPSDPNRRFLGFRLDPQGVPTFRYQIGDSLVEDRIAPLTDAAPQTRSLLRRLTLATDKARATAAPPNRFRLLVGKRLQPLPAKPDDPWVAMRNEEGLVVAIDKRLAKSAVLRRLSDQSQWVLMLDAKPLRSDGQAQSWEVRYSW